jgi:hypothetical protein
MSYEDDQIIERDSRPTLQNYLNGGFAFSTEFLRLGLGSLNVIFSNGRVSYIHEHGPVYPAGE